MLDSRDKRTRRELMCMGTPDRDNDYQNGRIAKLEIKVDWLITRMKILGIAVTLIALALTMTAAAIVIAVTSVR
jgi:hypothetical protein